LRERKTAEELYNANAEELERRAKRSRDEARCAAVRSRKESDALASAIRRAKETVREEMREETDALRSRAEDAEAQIGASEARAVAAEKRASRLGEAPKKLRLLQKERAKENDDFLQLQIQLDKSEAERLKTTAPHGDVWLPTRSGRGQPLDTASPPTSTPRSPSHVGGTPSSVCSA
jgi:hypothetical protein